MNEQPSMAHRQAKSSELNESESYLTVNAGSSSIKFALFQAGDRLERKLCGKIDRIGLGGTNLTIVNSATKQTDTQGISTPNHLTAAEFLIARLEKLNIFPSIRAIGHRVVHGMNHTEPELVTEELLKELNRISSFAPEHLPREIELIQSFRKRHPKLPQVACFDTSFHARMPRVAKILPIPRRFEAQGIRRYGFHGLSYSYLMDGLIQLGDKAGAAGSVILAHLGNGASMAAVRDGICIDTTMAFTPAAGLPMSTRSGDLDPGLVNYLSVTGKITGAQFDQMINRESGLLGISETSSDMRDLLGAEAGDTRAAEAVAFFCYQAKKQIGAYAAALGGLDTLVFSGGIGENNPSIRARICDGLGFLGIELNELRNAKQEPLISMDASRVQVRVIPTNEELMIARSTQTKLKSCP
ncbi:MAG: Acetate kinase [Verrucomicrobiales bacterium]|nr:Acetate kinase [Verrucomicrobiales bacterium]